MAILPLRAIYPWPMRTFKRVNWAAAGVLTPLLVVVALTSSHPLAAQSDVSPTPTSVVSTATDGPVAINVGGPAVSVNTEQAASFAFTASAGQAMYIRTSRSWTLEDPLGETITSTSPVNLEDTGRYVLNVEPGLRAPLVVKVEEVQPGAAIARANIGDALTFRPAELREQIVQVPVRGGQRYRLVVGGDQYSTQFCATEESGPLAVLLGCVSPGAAGAEASTSFVLSADHDVYVRGRFVGQPENTPESISARIVEAPNDIIVDTTKSPVVDATPEIGQSIVVPYWGSPAERSVISSVVNADVAGWGQAWIDREEGGPVERQKVFAVPVVFNPTAPPFVSWYRNAGDRKDSLTTRRRIGFYRGEDAAVDVLSNGEPVKVRNAPWFAAVGSLNLAPGDRYALQISGPGIRPVSLAVRDPSGKFTSNLSPWQWTEQGGVQRALTTFSADRAGRWAVEIRPEGNISREFEISLVKVGSGGSYKGLVDVPDVLTAGEETDVTLAPNEFARVTVKLTSSTPQIIQPDVLRFRNRTFQPTAADLSLWDSRGRLVWSNNRNLEEEVLSGRLGREPELSEKFATVASTEPYTLVIDPKSDISGRFRLSVKSSAVVSDVRLAAGPIPLLLGGTKTGVIEVNEPTRFRLSGASACVSLSSTVEWGGPTAPPTTTAAPPTPTTVAATLPPPPGAVAPTTTPVPALQTPIDVKCVRDGASISLPPGVHRLSFLKPVTTAAKLEVVAPGSPPDPVEVLTATVDGPAVSVASGDGFATIQFSSAPGARIVTTRRVTVAEDGKSVIRSVPLDVKVRAPDGTRVDRNGTFVTRLGGLYTMYVAREAATAVQLEIRRGRDEVQATALSVGAKSKIFQLFWGQRLEAKVTLSARSRLDFDTFGNVSFLYAADGRERRYPFDESGTVVLPPGTFRFVFVGDEEARIRILKLPLRIQ